MKKPKIKLTIVDGVGKCGCHRGHKIGDTLYRYIALWGRYTKK